MSKRMYVVKYNNGGSAHVFATEDEVRFKAGKYNESGIKSVEPLGNAFKQTNKLDEF